MHRHTQTIHDSETKYTIAEQTLQSCGHYTYSFSQSADTFVSLQPLQLLGSHLPLPFQSQGTLFCFHFPPLHLPIKQKVERGWVNWGGGGAIMAITAARRHTAQVMCQTSGQISVCKLKLTARSSPSLPVRFHFLFAFATTNAESVLKLRTFRTENWWRKKTMGWCSCTVQLKKKKKRAIQRTDFMYNLRFTSQLLSKQKNGNTWWRQLKTLDWGKYIISQPVAWRPISGLTKIIYCAYM